MEEKYELLLAESSILLVEDEAPLRESFRRVLLLYAAEVHTAEDGEVGYRLYQTLHPNIVITDIKMPRMSGLELAKKIRSVDRDIPIVVTSAYTDQELLLESIKLSLVEYLVKPVKEEDLSRVLTRCAQRLYEHHRAIIPIREQLTYDHENKMLQYADRQIAMTHKEIELFELLLAHRGNLVTKQEIEDTIYVYEEAPPTALKNLVFKLRKKLPEGVIETVGKLGYMIVT